MMQAEAMEHSQPRDKQEDVYQVLMQDPVILACDSPDTGTETNSLCFMEFSPRNSSVILL